MTDQPTRPTTEAPSPHPVATFTNLVLPVVFTCLAVATLFESSPHLVSILLLASGAATFIQIQWGGSTPMAVAPSLVVVIAVITLANIDLSRSSSRSEIAFLLAGVGIVTALCLWGGLAGLVRKWFPPSVLAPVLAMAAVVIIRSFAPFGGHHLPTLLVVAGGMIFLTCWGDRSWALAFPPLVVAAICLIGTGSGTFSPTWYLVEKSQASPGPTPKALQNYRLIDRDHLPPRFYDQTLRPTSTIQVADKDRWQKYRDERDTRLEPTERPFLLSRQINQSPSLYTEEVFFVDQKFTGNNENDRFYLVRVALPLAGTPPSALEKDTSQPSRWRMITTVYHIDFFTQNKLAPVASSPISLVGPWSRREIKSRYTLPSLVRSQVVKTAEMPTLEDHLEVVLCPAEDLSPREKIQSFPVNKTHWLIMDRIVEEQTPLSPLYQWGWTDIPTGGAPSVKGHPLHWRHLNSQTGWITPLAASFHRPQPFTYLRWFIAVIFGGMIWILLALSAQHLVQNSSPTNREWKRSLAVQTGSWTGCGLYVGLPFTPCLPTLAISSPRRSKKIPLIAAGSIALLGLISPLSLKISLIPSPLVGAVVIGYALLLVGRSLDLAKMGRTSWWDQNYALPLAAGLVSIFVASHLPTDLPWIPDRAEPFLRQILDLGIPATIFVAWGLDQFQSE